MSDLADLATVAKRSKGPFPLRCPCGGKIELGGLPAPTYACDSCGIVRHSLATLVRVEVGVRR